MFLFIIVLYFISILCLFFITWLTSHHSDSELSNEKKILLERKICGDKTVNKK